jgi:hypothetical protein
VVLVVVVEVLVVLVVLVALVVTEGVFVLLFVILMVFEFVSE